MAGVVLWPSFYGAMFMLLLEYLFAECWFGPSMAVIQAELPLSAVGLGTAVNVLLTTLVSTLCCLTLTMSCGNLSYVCVMVACKVGSISPPILGELYDEGDDKTNIRWPLLITVAFSYITASVLSRCMNQERSVAVSLMCNARVCLQACFSTGQCE